MQSTQPTVLALFDFDGTLTTKDTMLEFIRFSKGKGQHRLALIMLSPVLILFKLGLVSGEKAKKVLLRHHFRGMSKVEWEQMGNVFAVQKIPEFLRKEAIERLEWHRNQGHEIVVVTASLDVWTRAWFEAQNLRFISTRASFENGAFTGDFGTPNCNGENKVNRIKAELNLDEYQQIFAYGDTSGDKPMLALADKPFYRTFS